MSSRLLPCLVLVALAGCKGGDALVVVTLTSTTPLSGIQTFHCDAKAGSRDGTFVVAPPAAPISLSSSTSFDFAVQVPTANVGSFTLTVTALDAKGTTLATQHGSTTTSDGKKASLALEFGAAPTGDGGGSDGATDGGADGGVCGTMCNLATTACGVSLACGGGTMITCPCHIDGVTPPVAKANSLVTLEGSFATTTKVTFGGSSATAITLLGPNRATVTLPNDAVTGAVAIAGETLANPVTLKVTTYTPGIGIFANEYMQNDFAHVMQQPLIDRGSQATLNVGGHVLLIGGVSNLAGTSGNPALSSFEIAAINADGSLGRFTTDATRALVQARAAMTAVQLGLVYVIGGWDNDSMIYGSVEEAQINGDGTGIQAFTKSSVALVTPRYLHTSKVIGSYLYVFGGFTSGSIYSQTSGLTATASIERAPINASGILGAFETVTPALTTPRAGASVEVVGNTVYVLGGFSGAGAILSSVEQATIKSDGTLDSFGAAPTGLDTPRAGAGSMLLGGQLYLIGGYGGASPAMDLQTVVSAPVVIGALGTFTQASPMLGTRALFGQPLIVGNELFVVGGGAGTSGSDVEYATLAPTATVGPFTALTGMTTSAFRSGAGAAVLGQKLYLFGGGTGATRQTIESAVIGPDGSLQAFAKETAALTQQRFEPGVAVLGNTIYVFGGVSGQGSPAADVFDASGGNLTAITTGSPPALQTDRSGMQLVATDGALWALGGVSPAAGETYEGLKLNSDGTLGGEHDVGLSLPHVHALGEGALIGGTYYLFGSAANEGPYTDGDVSKNFLTTGFGAENIGLLSDTRAGSALIHVGDTLALVTGNLYVSGEPTPDPKAFSLAILTAGNVVEPDTYFNTITPNVNTARFTPAAAAVGNYVYIIGGYNNGDLDTIEQAPLQ